MKSFDTINQKDTEKLPKKEEAVLDSEKSETPVKKSIIRKIFFTPINIIPEKNTLNKEKKSPQKINKEVKKPKGNASPKPFYQKLIIGTAKFIFFTVSFSILFFGSAVMAYKNQFADKAYFGVKILGEEVGGKNRSEIEGVIAEKLKAINFTFDIDGQKICTEPSALGVKFDTENTIQNAMEQFKSSNTLENYYNAAYSLIYRLYPEFALNFNQKLADNINLYYEINDSKLASFTQNLSSRFFLESKNAGLVMKGTDVQVIPAVAGRKIVTDSVKEQISLAVSRGQSEQIAINVEKIDPAILEADTKQSIDEAKRILETSVSYHYKDQNFVPEKEIVGSWIVFNNKTINGSQKLVPSVDAKLVYSYIYNLAAKINIKPVNKKVTIKNGKTQTVVRDGKNGLAVDVDKASSLTAKSLSNFQTVDLELPTYVVKPLTIVNNIVVANWAKYITVDISTQKMCAWRAGGVRVNCWSVTTGQNNVINGFNTNTPTGTFLILRKSGAGGQPGSYGGGVCMPNPPSPYPLCGINYVSTFTAAGHAIHEAWWRSSFGGQDYRWNGSHGCVNATYNIAKFIYYWAPIGTPVIISY